MLLTVLMDKLTDEIDDEDFDQSVYVSLPELKKIQGFFKKREQFKAVKKYKSRFTDLVNHRLAEILSKSESSSEYF